MTQSTDATSHNVPELLEASFSEILEEIEELHDKALRTADTWAVMLSRKAAIAEGDYILVRLLSGRWQRARVESISADHHKALARGELIWVIHYIHINKDGKNTRQRDLSKIYGLVRGKSIRWQKIKKEELCLPIPRIKRS